MGPRCRASTVASAWSDGSSTSIPSLAVVAAGSWSGMDRAAGQSCVGPGRARADAGSGGADAAAGGLASQRGPGGVADGAPQLARLDRQRCAGRRPVGAAGLHRLFAAVFLQRRVVLAPGPAAAWRDQRVVG